MKLTAGRYAIILLIQTILLLVDCIINVTSVLTRQHNAIMLVLFIVQDACLLLALSLLLLTFFSTYIFQTGLVYLLYERFRSTLMICTFYFILTTFVNVWSLVARWNTLGHSWTTAFLVFFILQRLTATIYYYCYKRAALRLSDPRFYEDVEWEQQQKQIRAMQGNGLITQ